MDAGSDLTSCFDRVTVVSLARRPDRMSAFFHDLAQIGWPFKQPEVFHAIDGSKLPLPYAWPEGDGAWGCMQSHRQVLEQAILAGAKSLLVLEDDAVFRPSFGQDIAAFLADIPPDWEGLMLGGQGFDMRPIKPGVLRCFNCHRTHAYAVRGRYLRELYQHWISTVGHCDHRMGEIQHRYKIYAPDPFLVGQRQGKSDINGGLNPVSFWVTPKPDAPVVLLRAPSAILPELRRFGFHTGNERDPDTDLDVGLRDLFLRPDEERVAALREWIELIQWEVASMDGSVCTVWHPQASVELIRAAVQSPVMVISASTPEEALRQLRPDDLELEERVNRPDAVVLLRAPRAVVQELRASGFHTGFWRDETSDIDHGLLDIFSEVQPSRRIDRLKSWFSELGREAERMNAVVTVWHPDATSDLLRTATDKPVIEIDAEDAGTALAQWRRMTQQPKP